MVTVEHCKEVGITNSVAAFTSPRQTSFRRDIMVSNKNMCWEYGFLFNLLSDDRCCQQAWLSSHCSCCQPSVMVWNLLFTIILHCVDDAMVEQKANQFLFELW